MERRLIGRRRVRVCFFSDLIPPQACLEVTMHDPAEELLVLMLLLLRWLFAGSSQCKVMQTGGRQVVHAWRASARPSVGQRQAGPGRTRLGQFIGAPVMQ